MQNKPNFLDAQMNINTVLTKDYENKRLRTRRENKPKTNPIKPNYFSNAVKYSLRPIRQAQDETPRHWQAGHASPTTTAIYAKTNNKARKRQVEALDEQEFWYTTAVERIYYKTCIDRDFIAK